MTGGREPPNLTIGIYQMGFPRGASPENQPREVTNA
jgi:hypothetical protein